MLRVLPFSIAPWLLASAFVLATGCSSDSSGSEGSEGSEETAGGDSVGDGQGSPDGQVDASTDEDVVTNAGDYCLTSADCTNGWCDKRKLGCVQCYVNGHCPDGQACFNGLCLETATCASDEDCPDGKCVGGSCVECAESSDCDYEGWECAANVCRPAPKPCTSDDDCLGTGGSCSPSLSVCIDCLDQSQCVFAEFCLDGACLPDSCTPGEAKCATETSVSICRADGQGSYIEGCEEGLQCVGGQCTDPNCDEPGTQKCVQGKLEFCTEQGQKGIEECLPNEECLGDQCVPIRQRVLVIFDTSGSMNADPQIQNYPDLCAAAAGENERCIEPWPTCDPVENPFTVLGVSKKVFGQFFQSDESQDVYFALQRFPQQPANAAPVCDGGYYKGNVVVTGDNNVHELPLGTATWFDTSLSEVVLVPFPPPDSSSNLLALTQWVDFKENLFKTEDPCFQSSDCNNGICLGPTGNKRCHLFTNPEIRAHGWTPLGKSLFYAGEYFRRYVVIDGKPCSDDSECASPGYYCSAETKKCVDPRKGCRLNVVVMFTDGGETQFPFTNDFFNPQVQAKRLRYGLGCVNDSDCAALPYCRDKLVDKKCKKNEDCSAGSTCHFTGFCTDKADDDPECFQAFCKTTDTGGYCTNAVIEGVDPVTGASIIGGAAQPVISLRDDLYAADRLTDYNGNPINLIVNVVDGSQADPESVAAGALSANFQIALNGGGLHVVVSPNNEADFLAKLRATIDFKSLYKDCIVEQ